MGARLEGGRVDVAGTIKVLDAPESSRGWRDDELGE